MEKKTRQMSLDKEWLRLIKQEEKFFSRRIEKKESVLNQKLDEKVPEKLQQMLDKAFNKAFTLIFEKGTGIIEKTFKKEEMEQTYQIQQYASALKKDRKSIRAISNKAVQSGAKNLMLSGAMGVGMGAFGIGLPDIPVFSSMILKSIYETSLRYGYGYESENERILILLIIQGAVSYGQPFHEINQKIDHYIEKGRFELRDSVKEHIDLAAESLSKELLYMKFLQGIPVAGVVGGFYDAIYMKRITEFAQLKYQKRYLYDQKMRSALH